ncbi:carbonic anhydrase [Nitrosococcus wardiae]|uniref:carbonic anhydrase n=1 Tax=Nitrosococcus wardiae TaxID=1814290 RepID=A0A4P7C1R0_9GAMM|nr:carbonic anhydrase family protein [Nitrosococcus wardiae]QBQ55560.1 carbonic anhydrase family protein [Nitrosococcus wardiae]
MKESRKLITIVALSLSAIAPSSADQYNLFQKLPLIAGAYTNLNPEYKHILRGREDETIWGYDDYNGPDKWAELDSNFYLCSEGMEQSPIDIDPMTAIPKDLSDIGFFYQPTSVHIFNNGRTIELEYDPGSFIEIENIDYELHQFHFHSHSEHTLALGARFDMEMHLVHLSIDPDSDTPVAVVTVFIREGEENQILKRVWQHLPIHEGNEFYLPFSLNIGDALPTHRRTYRYKGSFTTPPCTEGVQWVVLKQPIEMSREQIEKFRKILNHSCCANNYRPIQKINGRQIFFDTTQEGLPE